MKLMTVPIFCVLIALLCLSPATTEAFNQLKLIQLQTSNACPGCDLSNAVLAGRNLSGATWTNGTLVCAYGSTGKCNPPVIPPGGYGINSTVIINSTIQ